MAIIKSKDLRKMDEKAKSTKLVELRNELISINAQIAMGTVPENPGRVKEIKKTIAKILTVKKQMESEDKV
jgi:large subunit ribosomal protein L29